MQLISEAFEHLGHIPKKYTCEGDGVNPPLSFINVPEDTISLVFIMDDPDVPSSIREDNMWDHWIIWNIDPKIGGIGENDTIDGTYGITTSDTLKYVPPCPPDREHKYFFKLYALDTKLSLIEGSSKKDVENAIEGHVLAQAQLVGKYCKKQNRATTHT